MNFEAEPTLNKIDDYNNNESAEKRWTVRLIIIGILIVGGVYTYLITSSEMPSGYIGTPENPGMGVKLY